MNKTRMRRSLVALATALACVAAMASPAAAATHNVEITGGTIVLSKTGVTETIDLNPTTPSCTSPSTLTVDTGTETTGASILVTALNSSHVQPFSGSGSYLSVMTRSTIGNSAGTTSGSNPVHIFSSLRVGITVAFYNTTSCTPTGTPICQIALVLHLTSTSTSYTITNTFSATGTTVGTVVANPTCTAGPSQLLGTTSTTTSPITGTITT